MRSNSFRKSSTPTFPSQCLLFSVWKYQEFDGCETNGLILRHIECDLSQLSIRNHTRCSELILFEFRQLPSAEHHVVAHQQRRRHLRVAVLGRMQVEHELAERA